MARPLGGSSPCVEIPRGRHRVSDDPQCVRVVTRGKGPSDWSAGQCWAPRKMAATWFGQEIIDSGAGSNYVELAERFGRSPRQIRRIVSRA